VLQQVVLRTAHLISGRRIALCPYPALVWQDGYLTTCRPTHEQNQKKLKPEQKTANPKSQTRKASREKKLELTNLTDLISKSTKSKN
jgi:hypothetical protein